ncbi:sulfur carrier protein ThiS adenylyltransferase [Aeromonas sp. BIGb0405]|uniref:HesA/MoeB/ThiF family protein n=1 Tax=Aeromonas sp. BIGb0405 TaxID=2940592 RepID=UPI0021673F9A|nr:HesA/MoeB/ThiF family protein [Aeromonas sp. BIGb0405]MCS3457313.1 sulfur carrier protein ThiS adenylyltransferase [Aeromonas sp. BIGb0405]
MRSDEASLRDEEYLRYGRQLMLAEIGEAGQVRLKAKSVLIVGLGGLGSPLALYLAGAGVGTLWLADGDVVDSSNLPRQILFDGEGLRRSKAELARERLAAHNPHVELIAINQRLDAHSLPAFVAEVDLVIDCCDNLASRHAINAACVAQGKPWISAAAVGWQGQLMVRSAPEHACYACLYPADTEIRESCQSSGVTGPLVGVMGSLQALEALKLLLGRPSPVAGTLRRFDALAHEWQTLRLPADPACPVCGSHKDDQ